MFIPVLDISIFFFSLAHVGRVQLIRLQAKEFATSTGLNPSSAGIKLKGFLGQLKKLNLEWDGKNSKVKVGKFGCLSGQGRCLNAGCNPTEVGKAYIGWLWKGTVLKVRC